MYTSLKTALFVLGMALPTYAAQEKLGKSGIMVTQYVAPQGRTEAGLEPGDLILAWQRSSSMEGARLQGEMNTPFDWRRFEVEELPRGKTSLRILRGSKALTISAIEGSKISVRPRFSGPCLGLYEDAMKRAEGVSWEQGLTALSGLYPLLSGREAAWLTLSRADLLRDHRLWDRAILMYQEALPLLDDEDIGRAMIWERIGFAHEMKGELQPAVAAYEHALSAWHSDLGRALILVSLGFVHKRSAPELAWKYWSEVYEIRKQQAPGSLAFAAALLNLGTLERAQGALLNAELHYQSAIAIQELKAPNSTDMASSLNNLGVVAYMRGSFQEAERYLNRCLEIMSRLKPGSMDLLNVWNNLGMIANERGAPEDAETYYRQALALAEDLSPGQLSSTPILINLASLATARGAWLEAETYFKQAAEIIARRAPGSMDEALLQSNLSELALARGDRQHAETCLLRALTLKEKWAPYSLEKARTLRDLAHLAIQKQQWRRARTYLEQALEIQNQLAPASMELGRSYHQLALVDQEQGKPSEALLNYRRALQALEAQIGKLGGGQQERARYRASFKQIYDDYLILLEARGLHEEAFLALERSRARGFLQMLAERDLVYADDQIPDDLSAQRRKLGHLYETTQTRLWQEQGDATQTRKLQAQLNSYRQKYQQVTEAIRERSPHLASLIYPQPLDFNGARSMLEQGTTLVSYRITAERTFLFVLSRDQPLKVFTLNRGSAYFQDQVNQFRAHFHIPPKGGAVSERLLDRVSRNLFQDLIQPCITAIEDAERLIIIADGPLWSLPFAALKGTLGKGGKEGYLIEWKPITTVASATVYKTLQERTGPSGTRKLVVFGNPIYPSMRKATPSREPAGKDGTVHLDQLTPLPYTVVEAKAIAAAYGGQSEVYLGADATEAAAKRTGSEVDTLHFACHGYADLENPLNSALMLTVPERPQPGQENGVLCAWEIFESMRIRADLVVLSACDTAMGKELAGEGLMSLTRAFQYAGARSIVASLWPVSDASTAHLMGSFYQNLKRGDSKDQALRKAQLAFLNRAEKDASNPDLSHPYYWAAFMLVGPWR